MTDLDCPVCDAELSWEDLGFKSSWDGIGEFCKCPQCNAELEVDGDYADATFDSWWFALILRQ